MKIKVIVTLKSGVLDPQGKAIQQTLNGMGFANVKDVRQGKYFDIDKQKVLKWNDIRVNIKWPIKSKPIMSKRDE